MGVSSEMRVSLELARELNGLKQSEAAQKIGVPYDRLIFLSLDFGLTEKRTEKPERKSS